LTTVKKELVQNSGCRLKRPCKTSKITIDPSEGTQNTSALLCQANDQSARQVADAIIAIMKTVRSSISQDTESLASRLSRDLMEQAQFWK
jgi:hypothetical protein